MESKVIAGWWDRVEKLADMKTAIKARREDLSLHMRDVIVDLEYEITTGEKQRAIYVIARGGDGKERRMLKMEAQVIMTMLIIRRKCIGKGDYLSKEASAYIVMVLEKWRDNHSCHPW